MSITSKIPYEVVEPAGSARKGPRRLSRSVRIGCILGVVGAVTFLAAARWFIPFAWSDPRARLVFGQPCLLRAKTGIPCPFCGATRSTVAAVHGHFREAFRFHLVGVPLVLTACAVALWLALCAAIGRDLGLRAVGRALTTPWLGWGFLAAVGLFWIYKLITDWGLGWVD